MTWVRWFQEADRHVRLTRQPPVLETETMVFEGDHGGEMERYCTWDEAEAGHARWVAKVFKPTPIRCRQKA